MRNISKQMNLPNTHVAALFMVVLLAGLAAFFALPPDASAAVIRRAPNNLGLVGYWSFDDARGSMATDFSGNNNDGTLTNMDQATDWVSGKKGGALDFDGSDDYVDTGDTTNYQTGSFTLSAWIKPDDVSNNGQRIITDDSNGNGYSLSLADPGSKKLRFYVRGMDTVSLDTGAVIKK